MHTNTLELRVFGKLLDIVPARSIEVPGGYTLLQVRSQLEATYPSLRGLSYRIAVDHVLENEDRVLDGCQVLALLPPFSGG